MKKIVLLSASLLMFGLQSMAQDFKEPLQKTYAEFDTTWNNQARKVELGNKIVLIAKKWNTEWLPAYYAAYSRTVLTYNETDNKKKDAYLNEADGFLDEAVALLGKDNDETHVLRAMIANARIGVDPQARWQKYGGIFDENLDKAKELNPDNPRIYTLRGISKFYTPKMFGGGKDAAMPFFEKAEGLYAKQTEGDITKPYWGHGTNKYFIGLANGEEEKK